MVIHLAENAANCNSHIQRNQTNLYSAHYKRFGHAFAGISGINFCSLPRWAPYEYPLRGCPNPPEFDPARSPNGGKVRTCLPKAKPSAAWVREGKVTLYEKEHEEGSEHASQQH